MQETPDEWTPPTGVLGELIRSAAIRAAALTGDDAPAPRPVRRSLAEALRGDTVAIIAEIKRRSPSKGAISPELNSDSQARRYEEGGAAAISVLTEPSRFGGELADIERVRSATSLPVLRKDFHVERAQLAEASALGASAALLIVRALSPSLLGELAETGRDLGLEIVFEIRDERELDRALRVGARIIGVNNRNLETLVIDRDTVSRILPLIPRECIAIAESGYSTRPDIESAALAGADAVLIGSSLSASTDPAADVRELVGVPASTR